MEYKSIYYRSMKTTIDIPDEELQEAIRHTGAKTKKEAVVKALEDFNRKHRLARLAEMLGTFRDFISQDDLKTMREVKKWGKTK